MHGLQAKHAYLNTLLLLHSAFMCSVMKILLKGEDGGHALNNHVNYIVDCGKSWKNHGIVFLNFRGNLDKSPKSNQVFIIPQCNIYGTLVLTLKAPIMTATDNKFCEFFPSFRKK